MEVFENNWGEKQNNLKKGKFVWVSLLNFAQQNVVRGYDNDDE